MPIINGTSISVPKTVFNRFKNVKAKNNTERFNLIIGFYFDTKTIQLIKDHEAKKIKLDFIDTENIKMYNADFVPLTPEAKGLTLKFYNDYIEPSPEDIRKLKSLNIGEKVEKEDYTIFRIE